jgi:N-acetylglucosamine malate deacetylase 1
MTSSSQQEERLDVIAVGAHPDDVEIACGGTLARLVEQGYRVGIIDLTDGEPTPHSPGPTVRLAEARAAADVLGVHYRETLDLPNRRLFDSFEARVLLAKRFRKLKPKVVFSLGEKTPLASPDHAQAVAITDAAIFYARLSKWDEHFEGFPVHTIATQIYYRLAWDGHSLPGFPSQFVVDITKTIEKKMAAIKLYETQFPPAKVGIFERVEAGNMLAGAACGFRYGEIFFHAKMLGTRDLGALLELKHPPQTPGL